MGVVTAKTVGLALIVASASCCNVADTVEVRVTQVPAEVVVSPSSYTLAEGESYQLSGVVKDAMGYAIPGSQVTWSSGNPSIATVNDTGHVTGQSAGTTEIRGVHEGLGGEANVAITENSRSGRYPNEPTGLTHFAYTSADRIFPWPGVRYDGPDPYGVWWNYDEAGKEGNRWIVEDASAPISPDYLRIMFPEGLKAGTGPANIGGWGWTDGTRDYSHLYHSQTLRFVSGVEAGTWESHPVAIKLGFWGAGNSGGAQNDLYPALQGGTRSEFTVTFRQQNVTPRSMIQNVKTGSVVFVGQWHHFEYEMILNDIGVANGVLRWWIDNELIMEYTDVVYRTADHPRGFFAWKTGLVWGGSSAYPDKSRDDWMDISDVLISGRPLR